MLISEMEVKRLTRSGVIPRAGDGYEIAAAVQGYIRHIKDPENKHRQKLLAAQAEMAALDVQKRKRETVSAKEVRREWGAMLDNLRSAILKAAPAEADKILTALQSFGD